MAISLFAIIAAGMTSSTIGTIKVNNYSKHATEALALVEERLEAFRAMSGSELSGLLPVTSDENEDSGSDGRMTALGVADPAGTYVRDWTIRRVDNNRTLLQITVTVSWSSSDPQEPYSVSNSAYFCAASTC